LQAFFLLKIPISITQATDCAYINLRLSLVQVQVEEPHKNSLQLFAGFFLLKIPISITKATDCAYINLRLSLVQVQVEEPHKNSLQLFAGFFFVQNT